MNIRTVLNAYEMLEPAPRRTSRSSLREVVELLMDALEDEGFGADHACKEEVAGKFLECSVCLLMREVDNYLEDA